VRNRAQILDAAADLFAREGPDIALDEIARRAGVGAGTVHRHFPSKSGLLATTLARQLEHRVAQGATLLQQDVDGHGLFTLLEELIEDGRRNRALKRALDDPAQALREAAPDLPPRLDDLLSRLLAGARGAGAVRRDVDLNDVKAGLVGALAAQDVAAERPAHVRSLMLDALRPRKPGRERSSADRLRGNG
jgi:AcrR family transcriptional regulator